MHRVLIMLNREKFFQKHTDLELWSTITLGRVPPTTATRAHEARRASAASISGERDTTQISVRGRRDGSPNEECGGADGGGDVGSTSRADDGAQMPGKDGDRPMDCERADLMVSEAGERPLPGAIAPSTGGALGAGRVREGAAALMGIQRPAPPRTRTLPGDPPGRTSSTAMDFGTLSRHGL